MRVLVMGPPERETLKKLREHAESNVLSFDDLLDIKNKQAPVVGHRKEHVCIIPTDFRVVYSVEQHPYKQQTGDKPSFATLRHASISVPAEGKMPTPEACQMIIAELGFKSDFEDCMIDVSTENEVVGIIEEFK